MANFGVVKQVVGDVKIIDALGNQRALMVGDVVNLGDTVFTNSTSDKLVIEIDSKEITLIGKDSLKIDQSVVSAESFDNESSVQVSSVERAILEGQSLEGLEETAAGGSLGGESTTSMYGGDFTQSGHESNVFEGYGALQDAGYKLAQVASYAGNDTIDTSLATVASSTASNSQNSAPTLSVTDNISSVSTETAAPIPSNTTHPTADNTSPVLPEPNTPIAPSPSTPVANNNTSPVSPEPVAPTVPTNPINQNPNPSNEASNPQPEQPQPQPEINLSVKVQSLIVGDIAYGSNAAFAGGSNSGVFGLDGSYWLHNISENGFDDLITYRRPNGQKSQTDYITNDDLQTALDLVGDKVADAHFKATMVSYGDQNKAKNSDTNITLETNSKAEDGNLARFLRQDGKSIEYTDDGRFGTNGSSYAAGAFGLIELKGFVYLEQGKSYDFKFISDDGVRLTIDNQKVEFNEVRNAQTGEIPTNASDLISHGVEETVTNIFSYHGTTVYNGETGLVPINIKYYDINGRSDLQLFGKESGQSDFHIVGTKESGMYLFNTDQVEVNPDTGGVVKSDATSVIYGKAENIADGEQVELVINGDTTMQATVKNGAYELKFDGKVEDVVVKYADAQTQTQASDIISTKAPEVKAEILDNKVTDVNVDVANTTLSETGYDISELINMSSAKPSASGAINNGKELVGLNAKYYVAQEDFYAIDQAKDYINENPDGYNATFDAYIISNFTRVGVSTNIASESSLLVDANTQGTFLRPWAQGANSGNVKFTDGDNADSGKSGIVQYDGYIYLEGGKDYKFKSAVSGAQEIKINGEDIFHKVKNSQTGEESYNVALSRDRIIVETKNDGSIEAGTLRDGQVAESRGGEIVRHDGTSKVVNVVENGFYKFEATYLSSYKASSSAFTIKSVDENGNETIVGDTARGGLLLVKDYYEKGEDGKFYKAEGEYEATVSGVAENANDGDKVEVYHNGELLGDATVEGGKYSFTHNFEDKPSADESKFEVKYTEEIKKFNLDILNIDDNELDIKSLVAPIDGENGYTIVSVADDTTLDLSKVGNLDEAMKDVEKVELGDNARLENVSAQDMLDVSDKQDGIVLKIDGESTSSVTLASELSEDSAASADNSEYTKYDATTQSGNTVSVKIENEVHTDFN